eukprot:m.39366 g.39366  ORF g.39366 m.39366 type:complete len:519 (-) comp9543_c0_seq1:889-2445(-)
MDASLREVLMPIANPLPASPRPRKRGPDKDLESFVQHAGNPLLVGPKRSKSIQPDAPKTTDNDVATRAAAALLIAAAAHAQKKAKAADSQNGNSEAEANMHTPEAKKAVPMTSAHRQQSQQFVAPKTPGREVRIRPLRPLDEEIKLQKQVCSKSNEILGLLNRKASSENIKEARKSRLVETFRLEALTEKVTTEEKLPLVSDGLTTTKNISIHELQARIKMPWCFAEKDQMDTEYDIFLVINVGAQVACTELATVNYETQSVKFTDQFVFEGVEHNFQMDIQMYAAKVKKQTAKLLSTPSRIGKMISQAAAPMATRVLRKKGKGLSSCMGAREASDAACSDAAEDTTPNFIKVASTTLTLQNLSSPTQSLQVVEKSVAISSANVTFTSIITEHANSKKFHHEDYLTVFGPDENHPGRKKWTRYWAEMKEDTIRFWTSRDSIENNSELVIKLSHLETDAESYPISECARPHSFFFTLGGNDIVKLAADSDDQKKKWISILNSCMKEKRSWHLSPLPKKV